MLPSDCGRGQTGPVKCCRGLCCGGAQSDRRPGTGLKPPRRARAFTRAWSARRGQSALLGTTWRTSLRAWATPWWVARWERPARALDISPAAVAPFGRVAKTSSARRPRRRRALRASTWIRPPLSCRRRRGPQWSSAHRAQARGGHRGHRPAAYERGRLNKDTQLSSRPALLPDRSA
jgi:hypothetical protein